MRTIERKEIELGDILPHPQNREFPTRGEEWDHFEDDIGTRGIQEDLMVRRMADGTYQCLKGHRRREAGLQREILVAWCVVVECSDRDAARELWRGNMHRENLSPYDEACGVRALVDVGMSPAEVAQDWNRALDWVLTRQRMLDLGEEVLDAVRRPGRDRLTMGAVEEILKVPEEFWPAAVQLVLHPVMGTLDAADARDVLKRCLMEPKAKEAAWESTRGKFVKAWRKDLERLCLKGTKGDLTMQSKSLREAEGMRAGWEQAGEMVPLARVLPDAPEGLRWVHLAVKHGVAATVIPGEGEDGSQAVVNRRMIEDAEAAMAECGGGNWLVVGRKRVVESGGLRFESEEEEQRVAKAKADVEAGYDTGVEVGERAETVIEQHVTRAVMIDFTAVRNVGLWAVSTDADPMNAPEWVPKWARNLAVEGLWTQIDEITEWVMKLRI